MRNIKVHMYSKFLGEKSLAFLVFSYIGKAIINHHKRKIYNRQDMFWKQKNNSEIIWRFCTKLHIVYEYFLIDWRYKPDSLMGFCPYKKDILWGYHFYQDFVNNKSLTNWTEDVTEISPNVQNLKKPSPIFLNKPIRGSNAAIAGDFIGIVLSLNFQSFEAKPVSHYMKFHWTGSYFIFPKSSPKISMESYSSINLLLLKKNPIFADGNIRVKISMTSIYMKTLFQMVWNVVNTI